MSERYERGIKGMTTQQEVLDSAPGYGRFAGAVFRGENRQSVAGGGCVDDDRTVAAAGDGDHRRHLGRRFSGDESENVPA